MSRDAETPGRPVTSRAGTNLVGGSAHNRRVILDALRTNGTLSRADLARSTLLTRQTTSNIMDELEAAGLVRAEPAVKLKRGQPAVPYRLVPSGAFAIGLHIDKRYLRAVAVDLLCRPLLKMGAELPDEGPYQGMPVALDLVGRLQHELERLHPEAARRVVGLGVAMPGPFGVRRRVQHQGEVAHWHDFPLAHTLAEATGLTVRVFNDAAAATLAEKLSGVAHGIENFVYVFLAHGIGAGVVVGGELLEGPRGNLGEIGEMILGDDGRSLEDQASLASLVVHLGSPGGSAPETFELIERALAQGDPRIETWILKVAPRLRQAVQIIESAFDPDTIVFGGELPKALLARLVPAIEPLLTSVADHADRQYPRLLIGEADRWAVALGAATEPISREFDPRLAAMLKAG